MRTFSNTTNTVKPHVLTVPRWLRRRGAHATLMAVSLFACAEPGAPEGAFSSGEVEDGGVDLLNKAATPRACSDTNYNPFTTTGSLCGGVGGLKPGSSSSCQEQICWAQSLSHQESKVPATHFYSAGCRCVSSIESKFPHLTAVRDPGVVASLCGASMVFVGDAKMVVSTPFGKHNCLGLIGALKAGAFTPTMTRQIIDAARPVCCVKDQPPGGSVIPPPNACATAACDREGALRCTELAVLDVAFYRNKYPDLRAAFGSNDAALKNHYLTSGIKEGRQPNAFFSPKTYLAVNADVARVFGSTNYKGALNHWITYGMRECRRLK